MKWEKICMPPNHVIFGFTSWGIPLHAQVATAAFHKYKDKW